ncbi:hypothetical protein D1871_16255 [Nakamurella silvestris]|nr:hypothetical protein D1871_16255 [Nakamurella silvestris]
MDGSRPVPSARAGNRALTALGWMVALLAAVGAYLVVRGVDLARDARTSAWPGLIPASEQGWTAYTPLGPQPDRVLNSFELAMPSLGVALLVASVVALIALITVHAYRREIHR